MKIPSTASPQIAVTATKAVKPNHPKPAVEGTKASGKKTSSTKQRIAFWCKSLGLPLTNSGDQAEQALHISRFHRLKEQKKLNNLQRILGVASEVSVGEQTAEHIDPDWFYSFVSMAENIYSPVMQELWGKIFAVEVQRPGSFSLRSLETLTKLTQRDATLFKKASTLACKRNNDQAPIIITGYHQQPNLLNSLFSQAKNHSLMPLQGLSYSEILALNSMKLIYSAEMETGLLNKFDKITLKFANQMVTLTPKSRNLLLTYYKYTGVGTELARLQPRQEADNHIQQLKMAFSRHFIVS